MRASSRNHARRRGRLGAAVGVALLLLPTPALAATAASPPDISEIERQIKDLQEEVRRLKRSESAVGDVIDDKIRQAKPVAGYDSKGGGFFIQNQAGDYRLKVGGYTQLQGRFFAGDSAHQNNDQFLFRRVRPDFSGSLGKYVDFKILPDFAGSSFTLFDAYVDLKPLADNYVKLRAGKFKAPVGLERLQSATAIEFAERADPTNLVPTRDVGLEVWGTPFSSILTYELGVFDGAADLQNVNGNLGDDFTFAGRLFAQPFITTDWNPVKGLGFGIAGSYGQMSGTLTSTELPQYRSPGQATIFRYVVGDDAATTAISDGILSRFNPQAYWYWGPFGSMFEYVDSNTPVTLGDVSDTLSNHAWFVQASWVLTGEDAGYRGITPAKPFDPLNGKWGAVEIAGRYESLDIDKDAFNLNFASRNNSVIRSEGFAVGVNWWWSRNIKFMLDYFHTDFLKGARGGNRPSENVVIGEIQLAL